ncbi:SMC5-SMC6 complex localization factor protein 1 isoform X1 [Alosa sapidissima]|uniref:SMC5-SMC6 complex localization factor protein 1 isoform X1 n=1 Tax=Alosa sapidissima TaxID=34773 RepID=UPI001C08A1FF|nr:SMC5-SMC6 complex localization factor protein 1 isoform X1 [Alosa sapidissima]XP_041926769.1 SMC5-SMC6 complex localization factor protein 1 isoform X1 [Alosa sapidissima]
MSSRKRIFQISGIKDAQSKGQLLRAIKQLDGTYIGGPIYRESITHLIVSQAVPSEKFLAACAGGKWIVTPEYLLDSVKLNEWLPEVPYEVNLSVQSPGLTNPVKAWREKVARGLVSGAFQDWVVLLNVVDFKRRDIISRILNAGRAVVYLEKPASVHITHVINRHVVEDTPDLDVPCTSMRQLALHLFGKSFAGLKWPVNQPCNPSDGDAEDIDTSSENVLEEAERLDCSLDVGVLSGLENTLEDYIFNVEKLKQKRKLLYPEFQSFYLSCPTTQRAPAELRNVQSLLDCGFFPQALEELQASLHPGVLPPAQLVLTLMQHALDGAAKPYTLSMFRTTLHNILCINSLWGSASYVKYFQQILQCPRCKAGVWSLLSTSFRVCMSGAATCHSLPSPARSELISFHCDLQEFILRLFQLELHAVNSGLTTTMPWSTLLGNVFWTVWERSTLSSKAVQQLAELLVEAYQWAQSCTEVDAVQGQRLLLRLQELLEVVGEFWCQAHSTLNRPLVDKGLQELGEHIAILCLGQGTDVAPDFLLELIPSMLCSQLRLVTADALYRFVCRRNGIATGTEALSLRKIVSTYLKALGSLCARRPAPDPSPRLGAEPTLASCASQKPSAGRLKGGVCVFGPGKENTPRGLNRVNAAGETLLHRACKRDQVDTLLHILAHPGTDVNVKDHAGWTPLHEACNHGSSACVRALLQHSPSLDLSSQVGGVSPLHDALLNGHVLIAKMLLQYGGSALLQLRDSFGRTPLDLVPAAMLREELRRCATEGDLSAATAVHDVQDLPLVETCSCLLACLLLSYQQERDLPGCSSPPLRLPPGRVRTLLLLSADPRGQALASGWANARAAQLAHDLETLLGMGRHVGALAPALKRCQGPHTQLLVQLLEDLQAEGQQLLEGDAAV